MEEKRKKLIDVNVAWKVMKLCFQHNIASPTITDEIKRRIVDDIFRTMSMENLPISELHRVCDERLAALAIELQTDDFQPSSPTPPSLPMATDQVVELTLSSELSPLLDVEMDEFNFDDFRDDDLFSEAAEAAEPAEVPNTPSEAQAEQPAPSRAAKKKQYIPEAENYSEKLKRQRKPIRELILGECVQFGLLDLKRAEYLICQLPGKEPRAAEKEVVVELRNNLYEQVRHFIREYKGGPWSLGQQDEVRLDIMNTPSVRSVLSLTLQLVKEQRAWLKANNLGHASKKVFGKKIDISTL